MEGLLVLLAGAEGRQNTQIPRETLDRARRASAARELLGPVAECGSARLMQGCTVCALDGISAAEDETRRSWLRRGLAGDVATYSVHSVHSTH